MDFSHYEDLSPAELVDLITQLQAVENAVRRSRLAAMAVYDRHECWKDDGATSMSAWMVGQLGYGRDSANEETRVAGAFEELPAVAATFAEGSLSWDQARAATEFVTPETDAHMAAELTKFSAPQVRRMARRFKPVTNEEARTTIEERAVHLRWDVDRSKLRFRGELPAAEGAVLEKALDYLVRKATVNEPYTPGPGSSNAQLRADALVLLASQNLNAANDADRATIAVHVDAKVLAGEQGMAEIECGSAIAMETARRLACDSRWYIVVNDGQGQPIGIGRVSRQIPPFLGRQVRHRDDGCRWKGCGRKGWINIHHLVAWAEGGPTDLDNLVMLCWFHHRMVHEGGWKIEGDPNGELVFIAPDGRTFPEGPTPIRDEIRERVAGWTAVQTGTEGPSP